MRIQILAILVLCLPTLAKAADSPLARFAQKMSSVIADNKTPAPAAVAETEPAVDRQVEAIQAQIDRQVKELDARMTQLGKQRKRALDKQDTNQLKAIEKLEKQAIEAYDRKLQRILGAASIQGSPPAKDGAGRAAQKKPAPKPKSQKRDDPPRRRGLFRLFGR